MKGSNIAKGICFKYFGRFFPGTIPLKARRVWSALASVYYIDHKTHWRSYLNGLWKCVLCNNTFGIKKIKCTKYGPQAYKL